MESILVPTDFSDNSAKALQYAVHIASESGLAIDLVHIYELPLFERFLNEEVVKTIPEADREGLFRKFIDRGIPIKEDMEGVEINWQVREGNVSTEIEKFTEDAKPLLIIMGSQGSGSDQWDKMLLGGTAQKVLRRMITPIMLVPPEAVYRPIRKIAFASAFGSEDADIIDELIGFAKYFSAEVYAVHIKKDKWDIDESRIEHMKKRFSEAIGSGALHLAVRENPDVLKGLDDFVKEKDITLLALLKQYHNIWDRLVDRSMAVKIALHAHVPTVVFKET